MDTCQACGRDESSYAGTNSCFLRSCHAVTVKDPYVSFTAWNQAQLVFFDSAGAAVHELTSTGTSNGIVHSEVYTQHVYNSVCFECGECFTGRASSAVRETAYPLALDDDQDFSSDFSFCEPACGKTTCGLGSQPNADDDGCEICVAGKFSDTLNNERCKSCAVGSSSSEGSADPIDCAQCEMGKAGGGDETCAECPTGSFANAVIGAGQCLPCAAGRYNSLAGSTSYLVCLQCEAGKASEDGTSACTTCPR